MTEGAEIVLAPPEERDAAVGRLHEPWIGDEGPREAVFERRSVPGPLRPRGIAFDVATTVVWDEAGVTTVRRAEAKAGVVALRSSVLVRERFPFPGRLFRIDYLQDGCLLASRYTVEETGDA